MLSIEEYNLLPANSIIKSGIVSNTPNGVFMVRDETIKLLRYIVFKSDFMWTLYIGTIDKSESWLLTSGDKIISRDTIKRLVCCDENVFNLYNS